MHEAVRHLSLQQVLHGHDGCINTLRWTPDGKSLISSGDDRNIRNWAFSPDGLRLQGVYPTQHRGNVFSAHQVPDREQLYLSGAADGDICLTVAGRSGGGAGGGEGRVWKCFRGATEEIAPICPATFLAAGEDGTARLLDIREAHTCRRSGAASCCGYAIVARACVGGGGSFGYSSLDLHPANRTVFLVAGHARGQDGQPPAVALVRLYDIRMPGRVMQSYGRPLPRAVAPAAPAAPVPPAAASPADAAVAQQGAARASVLQRMAANLRAQAGDPRAGAARLWPDSTGASAAASAAAPAPAAVRRPRRHDHVTGACFSPDGENIAATYSTGGVCVWGTSRHHTASVSGGSGGGGGIAIKRHTTTAAVAAAPATAEGSTMSGVLPIPVSHFAPADSDAAWIEQERARQQRAAQRARMRRYRRTIPPTTTTTATSTSSSDAAATGAAEGTEGGQHDDNEEEDEEESEEDEEEEEEEEEDGSTATSESDSGILAALLGGSDEDEEQGADGAGAGAGGAAAATSPRPRRLFAWQMRWAAVGEGKGYYAGMRAHGLRAPHYHVQRVPPEALAEAEAAEAAAAEAAIEETVLQLDAVAVTEPWREGLAAGLADPALAADNTHPPPPLLPPLPPTATATAIAADTRPRVRERLVRDADGVLWRMVPCDGDGDGGGSTACPQVTPSDGKASGSNSNSSGSGSNNVSGSGGKGERRVGHVAAEDSEDEDDDEDEDDAQMTAAEEYSSSAGSYRLPSWCSESAVLSEWCGAHYALPTAVCVGHVNKQTIKECCFYGPRARYVVAGSDDGCAYIYDRAQRGTGTAAGLVSKLMARQVCGRGAGAHTAAEAAADARCATPPVTLLPQLLLKSDKDILNCTQPHPDPYTWQLATSGIDHTVKVWAPGDHRHSYTRSSSAAAAAADADADVAPLDGVDEHALLLPTATSEHTTGVAGATGRGAALHTLSALGLSAEQMKQYHQPDRRMRPLSSSSSAATTAAAAVAAAAAIPPASASAPPPGSRSMYGPARLDVPAAAGVSAASLHALRRAVRMAPVGAVFGTRAARIVGAASYRQQLGAFAKAAATAAVVAAANQHDDDDSNNDDDDEDDNDEDDEDSDDDGDDGDDSDDLDWEEGEGDESGNDADEDAAALRRRMIFMAYLMMMRGELRTGGGRGGRGGGSSRR